MSNYQIGRFEASIVDGLKNGTLTDCFRWANRRRIIKNVVTAENESYSDVYHPWVREMHNSWAPFNYAMKGAQTGVTEVGINRAFYIIDKMKRDVLYVLPTNKVAVDFSKARFGSALAMSPYIASMFTDTNSVGLKMAGPNTLYIRGSRGDSNLVSVPVSELILDELDRMEQTQIELALTRLDGQLVKHVWGISTPTIPDFGIHKYYQGSTQEHFVFPCPCCSKKIELIWPDSVQICGEHATDIRCNDSYYKCTECGGRIEHQDKPNFLRKAWWEPFAVNANPDVRGFYINQLYSFTKTPGELVSHYFAGTGEEAAEIEFMNSRVGKPFIGNGARIDDTMLTNSIGGHSKQDARPTGNKNRRRIITMGVDRGKWNFVEVTEWFMEGGFDMNANATAKVLFETKFLDEHFDMTMDSLMQEWQVLGCVLDADPGEMEARRFARRFPGYVWLSRYRRGPTAKEIQVSEEDSGAPMATVDRSHWLSASLGRFKSDPTRIILPRDVSEEYKSHMKSLVSTYQKDKEGNPRLVFVNQNPNDHFAHARTYSEIALPLCAARETNRDITNYK